MAVYRMISMKNLKQSPPLWAFCPIQEAVIQRVEAFAIKDKQPLIPLTGLVVELESHFADIQNLNHTNVSI